jgi:hypothetical protein
VLELAVLQGGQPSRQSRVFAQDPQGDAPGAEAGTEVCGGDPMEVRLFDGPIARGRIGAPALSPIVDGFHCRRCQFRNKNRKNMKVHGNKEHLLKRVADDELFQPVRLQSWFQEGKERYWVVDRGPASCPVAASPQSHDPGRRRRH